MGPSLIFDKSTLESLNEDDSIWLENFFINNITPTFYVETLADLQPSIKNPRSREPEKIIKEIAKKTPIRSSYPNVHFQRLIIGNLFGQQIEMDGRPIVGGGQPKITKDGKIGVHYEESKESIAMKRWFEGKFLEIEKDFAKEWRDTLDVLDFNYYLNIVKYLIPDNISNLQDVWNYVNDFTSKKSQILLEYLFDFLNISEKHRKGIKRRWQYEAEPALITFCPYALYVFKVKLLFFIGMFKSFISSVRSSNIVDLSYLYYLPFCNVFVSNDKLHSRLCPFLLSNEQLFIDGKDLKYGLNLLSNYYSKFSTEIDEIGILQFAYQPPKDMKNIVSDIWDRFFPNWRSIKSKIKVNNKSNDDRSLLKNIKDIKSPSTNYGKQITDFDKTDFMTFSTFVPVKRGKWRILPKGIEKK